MSELGKRVAVAAVGIPVVLGLAFLGGWFLGIPLAAFAALGCHELARFAQQRDVRPMEWLAAIMAAAFVLLATARPNFALFSPWAYGVVVVGAAVALVAALGIRGPMEAPLTSIAVTLLSAVYVGGALAFAPLLHALPDVARWDVGDGAMWGGLVAVALPLAVTWIGDAAAFFAGTAWGKGRAKLAPSISPNKSWVGFWAALAGGGIAGVLWLVVARAILGGEAGGAGLVLMGGVGALVAGVAVVGDLVESLLKREAGVKDSGTFFPGHGGVLDRIDSLLFTFPTAYAALVLLGGLP